MIRLSWLYNIGGGMLARILLSIYLILIGICIGMILMFGFTFDSIENMDMIFRGNEHTQTTFTKYDQGIIISSIVVQLSNVLVVCGFFILFYETISYKFKKSNIFIWLLGLANTALLLLFHFVYSSNLSKIFSDEPKVAAMPSSESFLNQYELILKILFITLIISFFTRILFINSKE